METKEYLLVTITEDTCQQQQHSLTLRCRTLETRLM
jgi:hypothetical protein